MLYYQDVEYGHWMRRLCVLGNEVAGTLRYVDIQLTAIDGDWEYVRREIIETHTRHYSAIHTLKEIPPIIKLEMLCFLGEARTERLLTANLLREKKLLP